MTAIARRPNQLIAIADHTVWRGWPVRAASTATAGQPDGLPAGWSPGGPSPFGFRLDRVGRHLRLVVDEREAAVLIRATELIVDQECTPRQAATI